MLQETTLTLLEGQRVLFTSPLFNSTIIRLTREGVGWKQIANFFTPGLLEFSFRTTGITAYRIVFDQPGGPGGEKIHVIYKT